MYSNACIKNRNVFLPSANCLNFMLSDVRFVSALCPTRDNFRRSYKHQKQVTVNCYKSQEEESNLFHAQMS